MWPAGLDAAAERHPWALGRETEAFSFKKTQTPCAYDGMQYLKHSLKSGRFHGYHVSWCSGWQEDRSAYILCYSNDKKQNTNPSVRGPGVLAQVFK